MLNYKKLTIDKQQPVEVYQLYQLLALHYDDQLNSSDISVTLKDLMQTSPANIYLFKITIETLEKGMTYVQS